MTTTISSRRSEKLGWILGWSGGFIWVAILSILFAVQDKTAYAAVGMVIVGLAAASILLLSPWRHPNTTYLRLMVPIYVLFFAAVTWAVRASGDARAMGINSWWSALTILPLTLPLWTAGKRRWSDGTISGKTIE